jgi:hypothetical protein
MKRALLIILNVLALTACGAPADDPGGEIIETSKGVVGKLVTVKSTPSLKSGSLAEAAQRWQTNGWKRVRSDSCKDIALLEGQAVEAYEIKFEGYAAEKIPTRRLRLCAAQLDAPKRIAAIGLIVSSEQAQPIKP